MPRRILVVDHTCDPESLGPGDLARYADLVVLCWLSPDALRRLRERGPHLRCHELPEVVGGLERWERGAIALMERVCGEGPRHRGLRWRGLLEESLFHEALVARTALDAWELCRRLARDSSTAFELRVSETMGRLLASLEAESDPTIQGVGTASSGLTARLARRARHAFLTGDVRGQLWNLLDQLDATYRLRCAVNRWRRLPRLPSGTVTCFSSYRNNSQTLRSIEDRLPRPIHWLVTNTKGRAGATGHSGKMHWLWRFAAGSVPSGPPEPTLPKSAAGSHDADPLARLMAAWLSDSPTWRHWRRSGQSAMARLTASWERYLDAAQPSLVAVANQLGIEGWFAGLARQRGIPVLQVLHGIRDGEFYTGRPLVTDALVVWGELWRDLWPESERPRIQVCAGGDFGCGERRTPSSGRQRLTYFSWPLDRLSFYNEADLMSGFIDLFDPLLRRGVCELTLRAHPLENVSDLTERWRRRCGSLPPRLRLSQLEPLREVLEETDIAVMFRSTVMLDCFADGIPILIPGWIDFSWKDRLKDLEGVCVAADFRQLRQTLSAWLADPPRLDPRQTGPFLQRPEGESPGFEDCVAELLNPGADSNR